MISTVDISNAGVYCILYYILTIPPTTTIVFCKIYTPDQKFTWIELGSAAGTDLSPLKSFFLNQEFFRFFLYFFFPFKVKVDAGFLIEGPMI